MAERPEPKRSPGRFGGRRMTAGVHQSYEVSGGFLQVVDNTVTILSERAKAI